MTNQSKELARLQQTVIACRKCSRLVEYLLDTGRELGRKTAILDVSVENPRAEALYTRMGFKVTAERVSGFKNETARVPNHRRMERSL